MLNYLKLLVLLLVSIFMASCGSTGANGLGTTVRISAAIKDGTPGIAVLAVGTPASFGNASLSYNFLSTIPPHPNGIVASPVMITMANISFSPLPYNTGTLSPALPSLTWSTGFSVPAGGNAALDNVPVTSSPVNQYLYDQFVAPAAGILNTQGTAFRYSVIVVFSGYEINSGAPIICDPVVGDMIVTK